MAVIVNRTDDMLHRQSRMPIHHPVTPPPIATILAVVSGSLSVLACMWALSACGAASTVPNSPRAVPSEAADGAPRAPLASDAAVGVVLFDGVYVAPSVDTHGGEVGWDYVRFFGDGAVVTVSAPGQVESAWVAEDDPHSAKGRYAIQGQTISFSATSAYGTVDYLGTLAEDKIKLHWRSRINGLEGDGLYALIPLPPEASAVATTVANAEGTPPDEGLRPTGGSGWYCTHPSARTLGKSRCTRTARECQMHRRSMATKRVRERMSECVEQATASCHTVKDRAGGAARLCYERALDCTQATSDLREEKPPRDASDCAAW